MIIDSGDGVFMKSLPGTERLIAEKAAGIEGAAGMQQERQGIWIPKVKDIPGLQTYLQELNNDTPGFWTAVSDWIVAVWRSNLPGAKLPIPKLLDYKAAMDIQALVSDFKQLRAAQAVRDNLRPKDTNSALNVQVAGDHYKGRAIQPVEYIHANSLGFLEGCIVKRITRWRTKLGQDNPYQDLLKIKHEVDLLIELDQRERQGRNLNQSS